MKKKLFKILWPNKIYSQACDGDDWFSIAEQAGIEIPTGCLTGSCGACEIDVNGKTVRPCISNIENESGCSLKVEFAADPYW